MKKKKSNKLVIIAVLILLIISLFPYYYMILQSITKWENVDKTILPTSLTFDSYKHLLDKSGSTGGSVWIRALLNSFIVAIPTALITVIVGLMTGYSNIHMDYKGKGIINISLLFQMFFPVIVLLVPRYMIVRPFANNYLGMM